MCRRPRQHRRACLVSSLLIVLALLGAGCVTETKSSPTRAERAGVKETPTDACANDLHDLCEYLLEYWLVEHKLPPDLASLSTVTAAGKPLPLKCPLSGLPYVYAPKGLIAPGDTRELLVYDAQPSHSGARHGIVATEPDPASSRPLSLEVVNIPEKAFQLYKPRSAAAVER